MNSVGVTDAELSLALAPVNAPQLAPLSIDPQGTVALTLTGDPSSVYHIEVSQDLSEWLTLIAVTNETGTTTVTFNSVQDPSTRRFYRAKAPNGR
jgi:hypothetical protein